jgi:hypothetical protein
VKLASGPLLAPEDRLILLCCRSDNGGPTSEPLAELTGRQLDWGYIRAAALRHGVAPLLSRTLERAIEETSVNVPTTIRADLRRLYAASATRHHRLYRALRSVVEAFAVAGVEVLALKDVGLAVTAYPEPGLRPIGDLDLLIHREDYERAGKCLRRLGFAPTSGSDAPYLFKYGMGHHFRRASDEIWIDLQWNVAQREWDLYGEGSFTYRPEHLWSESVSVDAGGFELRVPSAEEMLLHLTLHLEGHEYGELILFCDVVQLLRTVGGAFDWQRLLTRTSDAASGSSVYHALLIAERLLGASVPAELLTEFDAPYFRGTLFGPMFGNLAALHESLDEIELASDPPQQLLDRLEAVVREQTAQAMHAYVELDGLATSFSAAGGRFIAFDGQRSRRNLPSRSLPAFAPLEAFVLRQDGILLEEQLAAAGFVRVDESGTVRKRCLVRSRDPALEREVRLTIEIKPNHDCRSAAIERADSASKRVSAIRVLLAHILGRPSDREDTIIQVRLNLLPAEEIAVALGHALATRSGGRLFALVNLLRILGVHDQPVESPLAEISSRCGAENALAGLAAASALIGPAERLRDLRDCTAPRLLERARVGAAGSSDTAALRSLYLCVFAGLSCDWRLRRSFVRRLLAARENGRPRVISTVVRNVADAARARLRRGGTPMPESFWSNEA